MSPDSRSQDATPSEESSHWSGSATLYQYLFPDDKPLTIPVAIAEKGSLHLEARYNYEDRETASLWLGWKFQAGEDLWVEAAPMAGLVLGNTNAFAPGLELSTGYGIIELYSEIEYVLDFAGGEINFFYAWTEVSVNPLNCLRAGLVGQRLRVVEVEPALSRGFFASTSFGSVTLNGYILEPGSDDVFYVVSLGYELE
jgi:hypothetical protein